MNVNITIPQFLLDRTEFVRGWQPPELKHDTLGKLWPQDEYRRYRSRLRFLLRVDASQSWFHMKFTGEIGIWQGIRWHTSK